MSAVFVGGNALTVECAQLWLARGGQVAGVASEAGAVRQWARDRGIPEARRITDLAPVRAKKSFDYLFSIVHGGLLSAEGLALPRVLAINFHDGLLPADAGSHASAWALYRGASTHGITWHVMTARADAGDILVQRSFGLGPQDTSWLVNMRCHEAGLDAFGELATRIESGTLTRTTQDLGRRTYHPAAERPAAALTIDPGDPAERIAALVRACDFGPHANGFGTAKLAAGGRLLVVRSARVTGERSSAVAGTVLACAGDSMTMATATQNLVLGGITTLPGEPVELTGCGIMSGVRLVTLPEPRREALTTAMWDVLPHEARWVERLEAVRAMDLPYRRTLDRPATWNPAVEVPGTGTAAQTVAAICAFLARVAPGETGYIGIRPAAANAANAANAASAVGDLPTNAASEAGSLPTNAASDAEDLPTNAASIAEGLRQRGETPCVGGLVAASLPLAVPAVEPGAAFADYRSAVQAELDSITSLGGYLRDVFLRHPGLHEARDLDDGLPILLDLGGGALAAPEPSTVLRVEISPQGDTTWYVAREALSEADTRSLVSAYAIFQQQLGIASLDRVPLLSPDRCVHQLVAAQAARTPHAEPSANGGSQAARGTGHRLPAAGQPLR